MKKVVVYTANFGGKDKVQALSKKDVRVRYICFSDNPGLVDTDFWELNWTPSFTESPRKSARWVKTNSHILFPDADYTIWVDGRLDMPKEVSEYIALLGDNHIASCKHPDRDCIYEEHKVCEEMNLDDKNKMNNLISQYIHKGYPEHNGLCETCVLVRDNSPEVKEFNRLWTQCILYGSIRDQLSCNYLLWGLKMNWSIIPPDYIIKGKHIHKK